VPGRVPCDRLRLTGRRPGYPGPCLPGCIRLGHARLGTLQTLRKSAEAVNCVTLDEIRDLGQQLAELCQKYGIAELSAYGSVARGMRNPIAMWTCFMCAFPETIGGYPSSRCTMTLKSCSVGRSI
jgi:hypothetical protein